MLLHHFVGERIDGSGYYQPAVFQDPQFGAHAPRDGQLLLHQQHSQPLFPVQAHDDIADLVHDVGLDALGGLVEQQQLAIGRAMVLDPRLLILDEPAEGIQPNIVHEIGDIILRLNREAKLTVLLVEQKLPFARRVASEFRIIDKGRIVGSGLIPELTDELVHQHLTV